MKKNIQISARTKWLLLIGSTLIVGSIVYVVTMHFLTENEVQWQYPVIIAVVLLLLVAIGFYIKSLRLEERIEHHCNIDTNKSDPLCSENEPIVKVELKP